MQTSNRRRATRRVFRRALAAAVLLGCVGGWAADALAQSRGGSYVVGKHVIGDGGVGKKPQLNSQKFLFICRCIVAHAVFFCAYGNRKTGDDK